MSVSMTQSTSDPRYGVLLINLGGPKDLDAVKPFLYNLFADPDIIKLPFSFLLQKPLAWLISTLRYQKVQESYKLIGDGSPILPLTQDQATQLQNRLQSMGLSIPVYVGMRYSPPLLDEVMVQVKADAISHLIVLPLYPQFSFTTTASSLNELKRAISQVYRDGTPSPELINTFNFYKKPDYLKALADTIEAGLSQNTWSCPREEVQLIFSAHSLPRRHVKRTQDPYPDQITETIRLVMKQYFPEQPWELAYQSQVGPMVWLGPNTEGLIQYFAAYDCENILMIPISFVSDHLETLYEIDQLFIPLAHEVGVPNCHRAPALNSNPHFIEALAKLVQEKVRSASIPHLEIA